ncbi:MAG: phosphoglycerate mutase (2,3-diphosphoglycerate-independent) [Candidatus Yanofskybacteria bacterium CG10_big_fil_rev_8_21_14_0_10_46_23]|uniref:2,3-bisphosphoglycerate-independent phosphoglycerate mutase n=1 Tax=Candidatus Yanofskybacteria bacterium CG10_big_fil_rev_8_21_14_0_10_46_23 TaxID=1975098 RepID=A0A2H0R615_9BACT|nr:MAG: phosphoglycerate mutase (2,3-diphosphoglycerate-independent) [Candidatus Yanofskybacteria bacterium CG10_big_fil_rev_8_21_14_0_10_46_23]
MNKGPLLLVILDGWGHSKQINGNPLQVADLKYLNFLKTHYPQTLLQASGPAVGLNWGEAGNSEVGHFSIGSGRIIPPYDTQIDLAIDSGELKNYPQIKKIKLHNKRIHLAGLLTSGKVHASFRHLLYLIDVLSLDNEVFLHLFTDGKDSGLKESRLLLEKLTLQLKDRPQVKISSIVGRNTAMDRNRDWHKTKIALELMTLGIGQKTDDFQKTIAEFHAQGVTDADIPPLTNSLVADGQVKSGDGLLFFNFREDSMRQIAHAFIDPDFNFFSRRLPAGLMIVTMTRYFENNQIDPLFLPPDVPDTLAQILADSNKNQYHIAESEKYAHVTYFFNGLKDQPLDGETDIFINSTSDIEARPEMGASEITQHLVREIGRNHFDFFVANYANADLLAHTGNFKATVAGVEFVDKSIQQLHQIILETQGTLIITADHGNVEVMTYNSGERETRHSDNPVPFILATETLKYKKGQPEQISGILSDIAPTILELLGIPKPKTMTGQSLLPLLSR